MSSHLQLLLGLVQSSPTLSLVHKALWRVETVIILLTLLIVVLSVARLVVRLRLLMILLDTVYFNTCCSTDFNIRFDKHGQVYGWLGGMFSCFNFINPLYGGSTDPFQGDYLMFH